MKEIILKIEDHLKKSLSKILYERDNGTTTIYPKIRPRSKFCEVTDGNRIEIDPIKYERKSCEIKTVLEIEGVILKDDKISLQVKIHEAMIREKVYEHFWVLDMEW